MITLKTLPDATAQEVYDQVKNHMLTQGMKSTRGVDCVYRDSDGLKCAAGCLISDIEYSPQFEGNSWGCLVRFGEVNAAHKKLIVRLQYIHDNHDPSEWESRLHQLAIDNGLKP